MTDDDTYIIGRRYSIDYKGEKGQGWYSPSYKGTARLTEIYDNVYRYYEFDEFNPPADAGPFFCEDIKGMEITPIPKMERMLPM